MAGDIRNAYLQAPTSEKHYIICGCGPEFGDEHQGKRAIIRRAIYGSRVAGRDFWLHLRESRRNLVSLRRKEILMSVQASCQEG